MAALKEKQIGVVVSFSVLNCVAIVAMGLRFYSIRIVRRNFKLHDALCIVSLVMLIGYTTCLLIGVVDGGTGLHVSQISLPARTLEMKVSSIGL
jgi:hypothetical protein